MLKEEMFYVFPVGEGRSDKKMSFLLFEYHDVLSSTAWVRQYPRLRLFAPY